MQGKDHDLYLQAAETIRFPEMCSCCLAAIGANDGAAHLTRTTTVQGKEYAFAIPVCRECQTHVLKAHAHGRRTYTIGCMGLIAAVSAFVATANVLQRGILAVMGSCLSAALVFGLAMLLISVLSPPKTEYPHVDGSVEPVDIMPMLDDRVLFRIANTRFKAEMQRLNPALDRSSLTFGSD